MSRILAVDHGGKRCGLAVTDPLRIIATALDTVPTTEIIAYLKKYLTTEQVEGFVVGMPMNMDTSATHGTDGVLKFIQELKQNFPQQWIETVDERFTSRMAKQIVLNSGMGRMARRDKGQLDRISATIILQGWMEGGGKRV